MAGDLERGVDNLPQTIGPQPSVPKVALQEYVDARFDAIDGQTRTAEQEREKAARELRDGLQRAIETGDDHLRHHVSQQYQEVARSLEAADKLEKERIARVHEEIEAQERAVTDLFNEKQKALDAALIAQKEAVAEAKVATDRIAIRSTTDQEGLRADMQERLAAVRRELEQATAAQKEAVLKAETANEKRFQSVDEWKLSSAERERAQQDAQGKLVGQFMPREVAEAQNAELRRLADSHYQENQQRVQHLTERLDKTQGQSEGSLALRQQQTRDTVVQHGSSQNLIAMVAVLISVLAVIAVISVAVITH